MAKANAPHPLADLTTKIGKITIAWNDIHLFVLSIFGELNNRDKGRSAAIFFAVQADRTQRNMTEALIKTDPLMPPKLRQAAIDVLNDIGKTAGRRNDLIHAMWVFEADWESGTARVFEPSSPRLSRKRLAEELDKLYEDALVLARRTSTINNQIKGYLDIVDDHRKQQSEHPSPPADSAPNPPEGSPPETPPTV